MTKAVSSFFRKLKAKFGSSMILDTENYPDYSRDASEINFQPAAIIFPENEDEVVQIIRGCHAENVPMIFRGAGTGYTGGAVPSEGALVISLERLKRIEIDAPNKTAFCGPGVITIDLMNKAMEKGLFYPPDPASYDESSLGGNVAENAGGLHCKKYGVTKDYVIGLRAVTVEGNILTTGIYNPDNLFDITFLIIGSEGLLAAVTEIAVRLIDLPEFGPTILAAFNEPEHAASAVAEITRSGIVPSVMEYMDEDAINCSMEYESSLDLESAAALLLIETAGRNFREDADHIIEILKKNRAVMINRESDKEKADRLWKIRRNLSKAVKASAKYKIAEDVAVPPSKLPALVAFVAEMHREYPLRVNSYGHAGDGNLHVNFLTSEDKYIEEGVIEDGVERLFRKTLEMGGTITGEHGIGLTKKKYLPLEFDPATLDSMRLIKKIFDPAGLLNPGKMFA